jgi:cell division septation protein DedD
MKRADFKEKSSVFFIGRWVIFLGIIITASLSFTLGFFVGKSNRPIIERQDLITPQQEAAVRKNAEPNQKEPSVQQHQQTIQSPSGTQTSSHETKQEVEMQESKMTHQTKVNGKPQITLGNKNQLTQKTDLTRNSSAARIYSIQIGAFRNNSDANTLKTKFEKKGYKTSVITTTTKKHEKIYKVLVGEFTAREEAELLSIKIKNTEGLKAFVTYRIN